MAQIFAERVTPESAFIVANEGSSRSSKTWDAIHFIVAYCDANRGSKKDIYMLRGTLVDCRDYLLKEWKDCLTSIGIYDDRNLVNSPKPVYKLFGQEIRFRGLDDKGEGYPSDILFFNEILTECNEVAVRGLIMRCRQFIIADWNPKYTDHWFFKYEKRENCIFTHSTYKQNRHLQESVVKEIEMASPWNLEDLHLPEDQRRPHIENIENGTADKYWFKVYGMGERASREGLVFPNVTYIDAIPEDVEQVAYGIDFGTAHPTVISKAAIKINDQPGKKHDLYLQKLFYKPVETSQEIVDAWRALGIEGHVWCDNNMDNESAGVGWIADMRRAEIRALATRKFPGSRMYWIATLKKFNIHIVRDKDFKREQENFCFQVVDGITLSKTIDKHDDIWSSCGYAVVGDFRHLAE